MQLVKFFLPTCLKQSLFEKMLKWCAKERGVKIICETQNYFG